MSAIFGIYSCTGAPIDNCELVSLGRFLQQMGPDGVRFEHAIRVAMAHRPFHTDRESRQTPQPRVTSDGYMLSWDGRLDNRRELIQRLRELLPDNPRTVDLVLAAYRKWDISSFAHLIGDFALALWDPKMQRLLLACDSIGLRPLYYHVGKDFVHWASRARALHEILKLSLELDEEYIANFLTEPTPSSHSPFKRISTLPGGHVLVVDQCGIHLKRYWQLNPERQFRYGSDEDYEDHFNELFREVVACRLRSDAPIFAELSGGLDSSSIVAVGDRILANGEAEATELRTVSYVFDGSASSDERAYIRLMEESRGQTGLHIHEKDFPLLTPMPSGFAPDLPTEQLCFLARQDQLSREMQKIGSRVVLSGIGGDQTFWSDSGSPFYLADLLVQRRIFELLRGCHAWSRALRSPLLKTLWRGVCWPLLPRRWKAQVPSLIPLGEWLDPSFVRRMKLKERRLGPVDDIGFRLPSTSHQYSILRQAMRTYNLERCMSEGYIEVRYPYLDRRLIEFALAIPLDQKLRPKESRSIVRRAMKGVLPEEIRQRKTKAGPTEAFHRALIHEWPWISRLVVDSRVSTYGFVNRKAFASALHQARHGLGQHSVQLIGTISLELWLRSLEVSPRKSTTSSEFNNLPFAERHIKKGAG